MRRAAILVAVLAGLASPGLAQRPDTQTQLTIGTQGPIPLESADGGVATSDVIVEKVGPDGIAHKHLAGVKYESIELRFDLDRAKALSDLIGASWLRKTARVDGSVVTCSGGRATAQTDFYHGAVAETAFPALDVASKESVSVILKIDPETTTRKAKNGGPCPATPKPLRWLASNFRLELNVKDARPTDVVRVEPFTVKLSYTRSAIGEAREYETSFAGIAFPNLRVYVPEAKAEPWLQWHKDFVILGKNDQSQEKAGALVFLSQDLSKELARINLKGVGIFRAAPEKLPTGSTARPRVVIDLYVEQMSLEVK